VHYNLQLARQESISDSMTTTSKKKNSRSAIAKGRASCKSGRPNATVSYLVGKEVAKWKKTLTQAPLATAAEDMQAAVMSAFSELVDLPRAPRPVTVAPSSTLR